MNSKQKWTINSALPLHAFCLSVSRAHTHYRWKKSPKQDMIPWCCREGILQEQKPRPSLTRSSCCWEKCCTRKWLWAAAGQGPLGRDPVPQSPFKTKGRRTCTLQMQRCTCAVGVLKLVCHPPSTSKSLSPKGPWFGITAITHLPSPFPVPVLLLFPAFRAVITLELETFDQPEQKFFTELLFCFYCASTTLLHLQSAFLHV